MISYRLGLKALAVAAAAMVAAGALLLAGRPQPIESAVLGVDWECTQTAFILTSCERQAIPAVETSRKEAARPTRG